MVLIKAIEKDQVDAAALPIYEDFEKGGSVPEWVEVMANNPQILKGFVELFHAVMGPGAIEATLKWKIGYAVSEMLKCKFCLAATTGMMKKLGATDEMISDITSGKNLTEDEKEILDMVRDVTADGHLDNPASFEYLQKKFNDEQIVEIVSVMGLFNYLNRFNNTLNILPQ